MEIEDIIDKLNEQLSNNTIKAGTVVSKVDYNKKNKKISNQLDSENNRVTMEYAQSNKQVKKNVTQI